MGTDGYHSFPEQVRLILSQMNKDWDSKAEEEEEWSTLPALRACKKKNEQSFHTVRKGVEIRKRKKVNESMKRC